MKDRNAVLHHREQIERDSAETLSPVITFLICDDAAAAEEVAFVVAAPEGVDHDAAGGIGGMDEFSFADVKADMGDIGTVTAEENQVTGHQFRHGNMHAVIILLLSTS